MHEEILTEDEVESCVVREHRVFFVYEYSEQEEVRVVIDWKKTTQNINNKINEKINKKENANG